MRMFLLVLVMSLLAVTPVHAVWFTLTAERIQEAIDYGRANPQGALDDFLREWIVTQPEVRYPEQVKPEQGAAAVFNALIGTTFASVALVERGRSLQAKEPLSVKDWEQTLQGVRQDQLLFQVTGFGKAEEVQGFQAVLQYRGQTVSPAEWRICGVETVDARDIPPGLAPPGADKLEVAFFCGAFPIANLEKDGIVSLVVKNSKIPAEFSFQFNFAKIR